jgi:hypothetical protein
MYANISYMILCTIQDKIKRSRLKKLVIIPTYLAFPDTSDVILIFIAHDVANDTHMVPFQTKKVEL